MNNPKKIQLSLLAILIGFILSALPRIRYELKSLERIWRILFIAGISLFIFAAILNGLGFLPEFLSFFNIQFEQ